MIDFQAYYFPRIHHIVTESQGYFFQINDFSSILYFSHKVIELDYGKIYRKALYLMVKTMVSCRFSLQSSHKVAFQLLPGYDVSRRGKPGLLPAVQAGDEAAGQTSGFSEDLSVLFP